MISSCLVGVLLSDGQTDICNCRVAFVNENIQHWYYNFLGSQIYFFEIWNFEFWPLPQKGYSKTFSRSFLALKQKELSNIRVSRNCQPIGVPPNAKPDTQEHMSWFCSGGAIMPPFPPCKVGLIHILLHLSEW